MIHPLNNHSLDMQDISYVTQIAQIPQISYGRFAQNQQKIWYKIFQKLFDGWIV